MKIRNKREEEEVKIVEGIHILSHYDNLVVALQCLRNENICYMISSTL